MATDSTIIYTEKPHRCGHCGATARMQVLTQGEDTRVWKGNKIFDDRWHVTNYLVLKCALCEKVNLVSYFYDDQDHIFRGASNETWEHGPLVHLYPAPRLGDQAALPKSVSHPFEEAQKVRNISPTSSILQARKTLEAICADKGVRVDHNLKQSVEKLIDLGFFPKIVDAPIVDRLRALGNDAAHDDWTATPEEAALMVDLLTALIGYVYEAPALVQRVRDHASPPPPAS